MKKCLFIALLIFLIPTVTYPLNITITQITDNEYDDKKPDINDHGDIVWYADDDNNTGIYLYESSTQTISEISQNEGYNINPSINNNKDVVWQAYHVYGVDAEILFYDGVSKTNQAITNNDFRIHDYTPNINDSGLITWAQERNFGYDIVVYDGQNTRYLTNTGLNSAVINSTPRLNPLGDIVWYSDSGGHQDKRIYFYDASR